MKGKKKDFLAYIVQEDSFHIVGKEKEVSHACFLNLAAKSWWLVQGGGKERVLLWDGEGGDEIKEEASYGFGEDDRDHAKMDFTNILFEESTSVQGRRGEAPTQCKEGRGD